MSKFTPGPWSLKYSDRVVPADDINGEESICHVYARDQDANRRLIAAAPEMYDLLSQLIKENEMDRIAGIMAMAEDLIKRIDG
jgi:hypothetical protein